MDDRNPVGHGMERRGGSEVVVPVVEEHVEVRKRVARRQQVRLTKSVTARNELVDVPLLREELTVERVPIGRFVEAAAAPRQDGDTLVMPVYEEVLVVEKRLWLREEVRVTRVRREAHEPQRVELRREDVRIEEREVSGGEED